MSERRPRRPVSSEVRDRRANARDRAGRDRYAQQRASDARRRAAQERASFDPAPADPDGWVIEDDDGAGLQRIGPPSVLSGPLQDFVRQRGWTERLRTTEAWQRWDQIVGEALAQHCEPVRLAGGVLLVRVSSQVWATQLRYLLPQLQANVEQALGPGTVRSVRMVVGPLEGRTEPDVAP